MQNAHGRASAKATIHGHKHIIINAHTRARAHAKLHAKEHATISATDSATVGAHMARNRPYGDPTVKNDLHHGAKALCPPQRPQGASVVGMRQRCIPGMKRNRSTIPARLP